MHPGALGSAAGITGWVVEQCQPPPAVLGGFMSPGRKLSLNLGLESLVSSQAGRVV